MKISSNKVSKQAHGIESIHLQKIKHFLFKRNLFHLKTGFLIFISTLELSYSDLVHLNINC